MVRPWSLSTKTRMPFFTSCPPARCLLHPPLIGSFWILQFGTNLWLRVWPFWEASGGGLECGGGDVQKFDFFAVLVRALVGCECVWQCSCFSEVGGWLWCLRWFSARGLSRERLCCVVLIPWQLLLSVVLHARACCRRCLLSALR